MRSTSLKFLALLALLGLTGAASAAEVPLFLVGGQSNTDGRIDNKESDQLLPDYLQSGVANAKVMTGTNDFLTSWSPCLGGSGQAKALSKNNFYTFRKLPCYNHAAWQPSIIISHNLIS